MQNNKTDKSLELEIKHQKIREKKLSVSRFANKYRSIETANKENMEIKEDVNWLRKRLGFYPKDRDDWMIK